MKITESHQGLTHALFSQSRVFGAMYRALLFLLFGLCKIGKGRQILVLNTLVHNNQVKP